MKLYLKKELEQLINNYITKKFIIESIKVTAFMYFMDICIFSFLIFYYRVK